MKKRRSVILAAACFFVLLRVCLAGGQEDKRESFHLKGGLEAGYTSARLSPIYGRSQDFGHHSLKLGAALAPAANILFAAQVKNEGIWENKKPDFLADKTAPEAKGRVDTDELFMRLRFDGFLKEASLGRQRMNYGRGFLIGDGSPRLQFDKEDTAFDAARLRFGANGLKSDLFISAIEHDADKLFYGFYASYPHEAPNHAIDGYALRLDIGDDDGAIPGALSAYQKGDYVNTFGFRGVVRGFVEEGTEFELESAFQDGELSGKGLRGYAAQAAMRYCWQSMPSIRPRAGFEYTYLSGDKPGTAENERFMPLFSSREYGPIYTIVLEDKNSDITGNINISNMLIGVRVCDKLDLEADFYYIQQNRPQRSHVSDEAVYSVKYAFNGSVSAELSYAYLDIRQSNISGGLNAGNRLLRMITLKSKIKF